MKPKILLVKHFDYAILGVLAILFLFAAYKSFIATDQTVKELTRKIDRSDRIVKEELLDDDKPNLVVPDYRGMLKLRFDRPAVISPYPRDPLFPEPDILVKPILLTVDQTNESTLEKVRLVELVQSRDEVVTVEYEYDSSENKSIVRVTGMGEGDCDVRIRDTLERVYLWRCTVVRVSKPPYPPVECVFRPMPPVLKQGGMVRPARVLVNFIPLKPYGPGDEYGITTGANIYRKRSDQLDMDYQLITPLPLKPCTQAEIDAIWERFIEPVEERPAAGEAPAGAVEPRPPGVYVPPVADRPALAVPRPTHREEAAFPREGKPLDGAYVYLDADLEPGETYIYKIVTVSEIERGDAVPCKQPFVSEPILVPSLISFRVVRISRDGARIAITVPHPETAELVTEEFNFVPGMNICGFDKRMRTIEIQFPDGRTVIRRISETVEFSTNAILVDTLTILKKFEYRLNFKVKDGKAMFTFEARPTPASLVLYLTQRGALRWKKEEGEKAAGTKERE